MSRLVAAITDHPIAAILLVVVLTAGIGAGAGQVEQSSSLDQFQSDTDAADTLEYIQDEFAGQDGNTTTAQIIVRGDNVLSRESLLETLRYQQRLRANGTVAPTLAAERPTIGIANVVATAAVRQEQAAELQATLAEFEALNASIRAERAAIQNRSETLNATALSLRGALGALREDPNASVDAAFQSVRANTTVELNETDAAIFDRAAGRLRNATSESEAAAAYELGTRGVLAEEYAVVREHADAIEDRLAELRTLGEELAEQRAALESGERPTLDEQLAQLESMNATAVETTVGSVLTDRSGGEAGSDDGFVFALMPTGYEPPSTSADATMLLVTQRTEGAAVGGQGASREIVDSQLAMQELGASGGDDLEYLVFGSGVINHEINASMTDSLLVVGPLALVFVLLALTIAYRDVLDILLGLLGIGVVLLWTFGFMGWAEISFNQLFVAVPVLLIGLSIDYAIHIFMRHREERAVGDGLGPRGSMRVALGGVGVALVLVTATTVIGFLSNLTSPVPPIREFGVVSSAGIVAALVVFGVFTPALKLLIDEFLERHGVDRRKRAFGTGGGAFGNLLGVGAAAARRAPFVVVALALLISAGGAYGATQVDTSFDQADFLAEDPPNWMTELPEPFAPEEYSAKRNLEYVNANFVREDSRAQLLVRGSITDDDALERFAAAQGDVEGLSVTQRLANGEADLRSPLTVMDSVAATNATFNATLAAADTDGDGVPDRDLDGVYDQLFAAAPDRAAGVVARDDGGGYEALRMVVSIEGSADGATVTDELQGVADALDGGGLEATATGQIILFEIVQTQLLETVIESLIVTLVVSFVFLMVVYRLSDGSATLGAVTLLPVVLSVSWILGTMYLLEIPFNVLTGMITSLTVGLGVAYSIHLSERYSQELERTGEVWTALRRAVTGTGGALLGSAATTVGGFGVLAFAVLPPLQQFGIITGLTIVYAFLASVLVLPSLLVVWTRYLGPREHREAAKTGEDPPAGPPLASRELDADSVLAGEAIAVEVELDELDGRGVLTERVEGATGVALTGADPDPAATALPDDGSLTVCWSSAPEGATLTYTATGPDVAQSPAGDAAANGGTDGSGGRGPSSAGAASSASTADRESRESADLRTEEDGTGDDARTVDDASVDGTSADDAPSPGADAERALRFSGSLETVAGERSVGGTATVPVVDDVFERAVAAGEVTDRDLTAAARRRADGRLTAEQFRRIARAWLRDGTPDPAPRHAADDGEERRD